MLLTAIFTIAASGDMENVIESVVNEHNKRNHQERVLFDEGKTGDYQAMVVGKPGAVMEIIASLRARGFDCLHRVFPCKWFE